MELNQFKHKNLGSNKISSPFCVVGAQISLYSITDYSLALCFTDAY